MASEQVLRLSEELVPAPSPLRELNMNKWFYYICVAFHFLKNVMTFETGTKPTS